MSKDPIFDRYLEGERPGNFETLSGLEIEAVYGPGRQGMAEQPGQYPFTRGIHPEMYRRRLWTRRQQSGYGTPKASNERMVYLLRQGQTGLNVDFDIATHLGLDPDHPLAEGYVGGQGTSLATLADMERLMDGIPLDKVSSTLIELPPASAVVMAMYLIVARRRGVAPEKLIGTIMNCGLTQLSGSTQQAITHFFPIELALRVGLPKWNILNVNAYNIRETGVNAIQEAAFALSLGCEYVERLLARGLEIDAFAPRIAYFCAAHIDLFEEVAKLRAMRRIWARTMREQYGAKDERSARLRVAIQTSALPLTAQEPLNNVVRATVQTLAAVLGGSQSIHTTSYDEAYALPSEESHRLSLRTQQVIAYETGVAKTVDPLGGSYFVEALTDRLEEEIVVMMEEMRARGGYIQLFKEGWIEEHIARARQRNMEAIESGAQPVVGVNTFAAEDQALPEMALFELGHEVIAERVCYVQAYRAGRDFKAVAPALEALERATAGAENVMPHVIRAVEAGATLGEVCEAFRAAVGYRIPGAPGGSGERLSA
jgi:methylmalonyl-CoA mutase N-terminal domain/subunit